MATRAKLSDSLRPASFRGVPFQVDASDFGIGRRAQVHEYPQRDKPWVEDLGRATREINFDAFVVGDDYVDQANKLIAALEAAGPGTLVHPWFGTLTVSLKELARVSFNASLGQARVTLAFVESGELDFPTADAATGAQSRIAAGLIETSAIQAFADKFSIKGFQDFVSAAANGNLGDLLGIVSSSEVGKLFAFSNGLASTLSTAIGLISNPAALGQHLMNSLGLSGIATGIAAWSAVARSLSRVGTSGSMAAPPPRTAYFTPSRQQAQANAAAVYALGRQALIAQAVGISSLAGTAADSGVSTVVTPVSGGSAASSTSAATPRTPDYATLIAVRDAVLAAIDAELLTADDAVYVALVDARGKVWVDLTTRARDSAGVARITPPEVLPALAIAYDYYEDAARADEIVARNAIRHPGFVPALPLNLLTR